MQRMSKLAMAGLAGVAGPLTIIGGALAGPVGEGASAVAPLRAPIEQAHYSRYGRHLHHYHTWTSPYARRAWAPAAYRPHYRAAPYYPRHYHGAAWSHYPRNYGWSSRPRYYGGPAYGAFSPSFSAYTPAGAVSYPVYRVDNYRVDYSSPTLTYGLGW